jgi:hypothetical protein
MLWSRLYYSPAILSIPNRAKRSETSNSVVNLKNSSRVSPRDCPQLTDLRVSQLRGALQPRSSQTSDGRKDQPGNLHGI